MKILLDNQQQQHSHRQSRQHPHQPQHQHQQHQSQKFQLQLPESGDTVNCEDSGNEEEEPLNEVYKGFPVLKGPRGGKYILKNGKKVYIKDESLITSGEISNKVGNILKSGVVYKVNILK